jgi:Holliday junction resolvasome RuvABC endonuclease subunit
VTSPADVADVGTRAATLKVAGLDPSLTSFGLAVIWGGPDLVPLLYRLKTGKLRGHERVAFLLDEVTSMVRGCDLAVVEGAVLVAAGGGENRLALAGLHWIVRHRLWEIGLPYAVVAPSTRAKWLTGNGGAGKDDCLVAAVKRFPRAEISGNDTADALALAAMGAAAYGQPYVPMPQDRTALLHAARTTRQHRGEPVIGWPKLLNGKGPV